MKFENMSNTEQPSTPEGEKKETKEEPTIIQTEGYESVRTVELQKYMEQARKEAKNEGEQQTNRVQKEIPSSYEAAVARMSQVEEQTEEQAEPKTEASGEGTDKANQEEVPETEASSEGETEGNQQPEEEPTIVQTEGYSTRSDEQQDYMKQVRREVENEEERRAEIENIKAKIAQGEIPSPYEAAVLRMSEVEAQTKEQTEVEAGTEAGAETETEASGEGADKANQEAEEGSEENPSEKTAEKAEAAERKMVVDMIPEENREQIKGKEEEVYKAVKEQSWKDTILGSRAWDFVAAVGVGVGARVALRGAVGTMGGVVGMGAIGAAGGAASAGVREWLQERRAYKNFKEDLQAKVKNESEHDARTETLQEFRNQKAGLLREMRSIDKSLTSGPETKQERKDLKKRRRKISRNLEAVSDNLRYTLAHGIERKGDEPDIEAISQKMTALRSSEDADEEKQERLQRSWEKKLRNNIEKLSKEKRVRVVKSIGKGALVGVAGAYVGAAAHMAINEGLSISDVRDFFINPSGAIENAATSATDNAVEGAASSGGPVYDSETPQSTLDAIGVEPTPPSPEDIATPIPEAAPEPTPPSPEDLAQPIELTPEQIAAAAVENIPYNIPLQEGDTLWGTVEAQLADVLERAPTDAEILEISKEVARASGVIVPEWGIESGAVAHTEMAAGSPLIFDELAKEHIKAMVAETVQDSSEASASIFERAVEAARNASETLASTAEQAAVSLEDLPSSVALESGYSTWSVVEGQLSEVLGRAPTDVEMQKIAQVVAESSGINVPEWGIVTEGGIDHRELPVGFKLVFDDAVREAIQSLESVTGASDEVAESAASAGGHLYESGMSQENLEAFGVEPNSDLSFDQDSYFLEGGEASMVRARELAEQLGIDTANELEVEMVGHVPVSINGQPTLDLLGTNELSRVEQMERMGELMDKYTGHVTGSEASASDAAQPDLPSPEDIATPIPEPDAESSSMFGEVNQSAVDSARDAVAQQTAAEVAANAAEQATSESASAIEQTSEQMLAQMYENLLEGIDIVSEDRAHIFNEFAERFLTDYSAEQIAAMDPETMNTMIMEGFKDGSLATRDLVSFFEEYTAWNEIGVEIPFDAQESLEWEVFSGRIQDAASGVYGERSDEILVRTLEQMSERLDRIIAIRKAGGA